MSEKKKDMFADLNVGNSSKYKAFNDEATLRERINKLDEEITRWSNQEHNISWANDYKSFYEHTKSIDVDIIAKIMNASLFEQLKREADYIIAKDLERKNKKKQKNKRKQELLRKRHL